MVISSQAAGSAKSTAEGSETRSLSSASNNDSHERPTPAKGDDIVRYSVETRRVEVNSQQKQMVGYYGNIGCKAPGYNCNIAL
jgi:hypothetical protein